MPLPELKFANRLAFVDRNHDGMLCGYRHGPHRRRRFGLRIPHAVDDPRHDPPGRRRPGAARGEVRRAPVAKKKAAQGGGAAARPQPEGAQPVGNPEKD